MSKKKILYKKFTVDYYKEKNQYFIPIEECTHMKDVYVCEVHTKGEKKWDGEKTQLSSADGSFESWEEYNG